MTATPVSRALSKNAFQAGRGSICGLPFWISAGGKVPFQPALLCCSLSLSYASTARACCSGLGVRRWERPASGMREAIRSGTNSGETDRNGYSDAGVARRSRDVVGCGARMVGESTSSTLARGRGPLPVRTLDGRICSNPASRATFSMLLKYCTVDEWSAGSGREARVGLACKR